MREVNCLQYHMDLNDEDKHNWAIDDRGKTILVGWCHDQTTDIMREAMRAIEILVKEDHMNSYLKTFKEHMQLENELNDWFVICHYGDGRIFFFAHFKQSLYERIAELIPYIRRANPSDEDFFCQSYIEQEDIVRYKEEFFKIIGKRIKDDKEFIGVVNFQDETVWWATKPGEFYEAWRDDED